METPAKQNVRTHLVSDSEAGQRLDNFLLRKLKGVPKSHVYRIVRDGQVRVNGGRSRPATRISTGDRIRIPPIRTSIPGKSPGATRESGFQPHRLFEDQDLLILDKPAGIAVHGGTGQRVSVIEQLRLGSSGYLELVHRLDKETSGILILAKNLETLRKMHNRLRRPGLNSGVSKSYQTLLTGRWRGAARTLHHRLETVRGHGAIKRSRVTSTGREACSIFHPLALYQDHSLMRVELKTGRLHQIRAHAHAVGLPVAGDRVYGDPLKNRQAREFGLHRQFLHAERICFLHPRTGKPVDVHSPLPPDLEAVLANLRSRRNDGTD
ncbi:MAG TPA: hypothetical protein DG761_02935 [Gammaproteobacteria bacterium]|nr:hypothetical protein [Acidiferrobacteraceae bacterium]HCX86958.1 hypothetical protein [Gammaproteobacteria bacterium]